MIMCHTANSHFAMLLPPGLTSQCISSIMQRHWDPFHCVAQRAACTQRSPSMIPRQALQCDRLNSAATVTASTQDACLPPRRSGSQGMAVRLPHIQGSSGVIISGSPQVTTSHSGRSQSLPKHGQERSGGEVEEDGGRRRISQDLLWCMETTGYTDRMKERRGKGREGRGGALRRWNIGRTEAL